MNPFGPHCSFELVRVSRRQKLITGRCLYVALLLVILGFIYLSLFGRGPDDLWDFLFRSSANPRDLANFGMAFFMTFTFVQYFLGTFAMASAAAAIMAEETEKQTLPFLLTTTLANHEIVLGKLAARVAQVLMLLVAGLPVLAIMQVMGGIDPVLLWTSFAAIGVSIISTAGVGAAISVRAVSVKSATSKAVGIVAAYTLLFPYLGFGLSRWIGAVPLWPSTWAVFTFTDLMDWLLTGNLIWVTARLARSMDQANFASLLLPALGQYVVFNLIVAVLTGGWTALRLRKILGKRQDRTDRATSKNERGKRVKGRRSVSQTRPVLWRETATAVAKAGQKPWHIWIKRLLFAASFLPLCLAIYESQRFAGGGRNRVGEEIHNMIRGLSTMVLSGVILHIATTASGMIGRERRKKTLEELCLTDLSNREILKDKAWAAVWTVRWALLWVAIHWAIDLSVGGLHPLALLIVPTLMCVYLLWATRFGILCSTLESPMVKAGPSAVLGTLTLVGLPWLLPLLHSILSDGRNEVKYTAMFAAGLSPPSAIAVLTLGTDDLNRVGSRPDEISGAMCFTAGLAISMLLCWAFSALSWRNANRRFAITRPE